MRLRDHGLAGGGLAFAAVALVWVSGAPAGAAGHHVEMENYAFSPRSLTVQRGDSVTWMNHDEAPHDAKTTSGPASFHSPMLEQGGSWTHTFNSAGTYSYYCTVHPDMKASIVVTAPEPPPAPKPTRSKEPEPEPEPKPEPEPEQTQEAKRAKPRPATTPRATPSAKPSTVSPSASTPATSPTEASPEPTVIASVPQQGSGSALSPLLLLAGLVTAVGVFCLLALASRPGKEVREQTPS